MTSHQDIQELIRRHQRRLQKLKEQQAQYGLSVDPSIPNEIEEIEATIADLEAELSRFEAEESKPPCPYPGMVPFRPEDARFFYGRKSEINRILQRLRNRRRLFVIGASGCGKSSLLLAGVLPRLPESSYFQGEPWLVRVMRPGADPCSTLAQTLAGDLAEPAQAVTDLLANNHPPARRLLLVIDQFEELFAQVERTEQDRFIGTLQRLQTVENCAQILVIRADFYHDLMNSELWPVKQGERVELTPLHGKSLRRAIERPAKDLEVQLEPGLVERLLADAADEPGTLPLVQETMVQLWEGMENRLLTLNAYETLSRGGRSGLAAAIADRAEAILDELSSAQQTIARRIFLRLIQFGQGRADTRRQQPVSALRSTADDPHLFEETLNHLVDNRLLTLSGEAGGPGRQVDIAHEALFTGWPTLRQWLAQRREAERSRRRLEDRAADWVRLGRDRGGLLDEVELLEAERWLDSSDAAELGYDDDLAALVQASRRAIEAEKQEKEAARRRELEQAQALTEMERQLAAAKQITTLGTVMAALQDYISDTLNLIGPNITRLRRRVDPADQTAQEILDIIERNARHTSDYIYRIQHTLKEADSQPVDLNTCLRDVQRKVELEYSPQSETGVVQVIYDLDDSLPRIQAYESQIIEIFYNLIENSYKAMGAEGGLLKIASRAAEGGLEVEISDTGPGIPPKIRDKLFTKPTHPSSPGRGAGLGLWLSALLLQKYAGKIEISRSGPQGTTVLVRLPLSETPES